MGGIGSGRHWGYGRATCEGQYAIDVRAFARKNVLRPGTGFGVSAAMDGAPVGCTTGRTGLDEVLVGRQVIRLTYTEPHLGGRRVWFVCPGCGTRRAKLYGGEWFRCRPCLGLAYRSQRQGWLERTMQRAREIRWRLGGSSNFVEPFPPRPKGMHHLTYARLADKERRLSGQIDAGVVDQLGKIRAALRGRPAQG